MERKREKNEILERMGGGVGGARGKGGGAARGKEDIESSKCRIRNHVDSHEHRVHR
jgi:hypothetical protein